MMLALFILAVLGCGIGIGYACPPGEWHARLVKPTFNPPNWLFAPVWTVLYVLIAIAGWRTWDAGATAAFTVWLTQLIVNFAWSPTFFAAHKMGAAFAIILLMIVLTIVTILAFARIRTRAALLMLPYLLWLCFAAWLNHSIETLNPHAETLAPGAGSTQVQL